MQIGSDLVRRDITHSQMKGKETKQKVKETSEDQRPSSDSASVVDYYKKLCSEFQGISFRLGDEEEKYGGFEGSSHQVGSSFSLPGQCSIKIDKKVIEKMMNDKEYEEMVKGTIRNMKGDYGTFESRLAEDGFPYTQVRLVEDEKGFTYTIMGTTTPSNPSEEVRYSMENDEMSSGKMLTEKLDEEMNEMQEAYFRMIEESRRKMDEIRENISGQGLKGDK